MVSPREAVRIQTDPVDVGTEWAAFAQAFEGTAGALVSFCGQVRREPSLKTLTIEHYPGMAEREIDRWCQQAHRRWDLCATRVIHRVGILKPGETIVLVMTAAPHRRDSFHAAEFLMDVLKTHAPFWKREQTQEGTRWVGAHRKDQEALRRWEQL